MGNTVSRWRNYIETGYHVLQQGIESTAETFKPGTPTTVTDKNVDCIALTWDKPQTLYQNYRYQIRYRCLATEQWHFYDRQPIRETIIVSNLRPKTKYTFQVRMINTDIEGPYSNASDETETQETAAVRYLEMTYAVPDSGESPAIRRIPLKEVKQSRDETNRIQKFVLGTSEKTAELEKTIILFGAKGTGKKTFIDGLINYLLVVHWEDSHRFTITMSDTSTTQDGWTTCYLVNPLRGSRLNFRLNIIDTPSIDVDDEERCIDILQQLKCLFTNQLDRIELVDAICFLIRAHDTQLSQSQIDMFHSVLTSMGTSIQENVCIITTFADCKQPKIIQALDQTDVPTENVFPINNAGLFVPNTGLNMHPLSPQFWMIGHNCFETFFEHISTLQSKVPDVQPVFATGSDEIPAVLPDRHDLEDKIEELQPVLVSGLDDIVLLKDEKQTIETNKREIEADATFTYTITLNKLKKLDLESGRHVTNCLNCHITCHLNCVIPRNEDKENCCAMDNGFCTECFEKCHWTSHANTPYIYEYVDEIITRSYVEKEIEYRRTPDEDMTVTKVIDRMGDHLKDLEKSIQTKMGEVRVNINILRRISGRDDTMTLHDQIDLLIQSEEKKRQTDFERRIEVLKELRKM